MIGRHKNIGRGFRANREIGLASVGTLLHHKFDLTWPVGRQSKRINNLKLVNGNRKLKTHWLASVEQMGEV